MAKVDYYNSNRISRFYQSYSGTDTVAFLLFPGSKPITLGSLTTISYSMFRNKKPVINIGRTNINGMTRGSRIFAGTMIFTLINQNWVHELQQQLTWLKDFDELRADELPLFDMMIISANEYGSYVSMYIFGIDLTDEAQTISVEDLFTENVFQFVARDVSTFKAGKQILHDKKHNNQAHATMSEFHSKLYVLSGTGSTEEQLAKLNQRLSSPVLRTQEQESKLYKVLSRDIYYSGTSMISGDDVLELQKMINKLGGSLATTGIFDQETRDKVMEIQSKLGLEPDGVIKTVDWNAFKEAISKVESNIEPFNEKIYTGVVVNKSGAYVYKNKKLDSDIVEVLPFKTFVDLYEMSYGYDDESNNRYYKTINGWVRSPDIYSMYNDYQMIEFPNLNLYDENHYVVMVQNMLRELYPSYDNVSGVLDSLTMEYVTRFQIENDLDPDGIVDKQTWLIMNAKSNGSVTQIDEDSFKITNTWPQGKYQIKYNDSDTSLTERLDTIKSRIRSEYPQNVKTTAICKYNNNETEEYSKIYSIDDKELNVSLSDFVDNLGFNPRQGDRPKDIEYIVYPYNKEAYKWKIELI